MFGRVSRVWHGLVVFRGAGVFVSLCVLVSLGAAQTAPTVTSGEQLPVPGHYVPADHAQLSEHNIEWLTTQPPQVQAEFLLGAAVNHDHGATDMITKMLEGSHRKLHFRI